MTLSRFCAMLQKGHLEQAKQIYGYLDKFKDFMIKFLVDEPDYDDHEVKTYDLLNIPYGNLNKEVPEDAAPPLGN